VVTPRIMVAPNKRKSIGRTRYSRNTCHSLVMPYRGSKPRAQAAKFSLIVSKYRFATGLQSNRMTYLFEGFSAES
jgi:hypothetical protein